MTVNEVRILLAAMFVIGLFTGLVTGILFAKHILIHPDATAQFLHEYHYSCNETEPSRPETTTPTVINNHYSPVPVTKTQPVTLIQPSFQPEPLRPTEDPHKYDWKIGGHS